MSRSGGKIQPLAGSKRPCMSFLHRSSKHRDLSVSCRSTGQHLCMANKTMQFFIIYWLCSVVAATTGWICFRFGYIGCITTSCRLEDSCFYGQATFYKAERFEYIATDDFYLDHLITKVFKIALITTEEYPFKIGIWLLLLSAAKRKKTLHEFSA